MPKREPGQNVRDILTSLGVPKDTRSFEVWNKLDQLDDDRADAVRARAQRDGQQCLPSLPSRARAGRAASGHRRSASGAVREQS